MIVKEAIEEIKNNYVITKNGILGICNDKELSLGKHPKYELNELLNMEVKKIEKIGQWENYTAIRLK